MKICITCNLGRMSNCLFVAQRIIKNGYKVAESLCPKQRCVNTPSPKSFAASNTLTNLYSQLDVAFAKS